MKNIILLMCIFMITTSFVHASNNIHTMSNKEALSCLMNLSRDLKADDNAATVSIPQAHTILPQSPTEDFVLVEAPKGDYEISSKIAQSTSVMPQQNRSFLEKATALFSLRK